MCRSLELSPELSVRQVNLLAKANAPPRFLCDEMLQRLGRWLRAAGYDTLIATDTKADYHLLRQAIDEDRLLITRDKELSQHRRAKGHVVLLHANTLDECAAELSQHLAINWQLDPFSRCLVCNTPLLGASPQQLAHIPPKSRQRTEQAYFCPDCRQVFWDGGHVKRMRRNLQKWQQSFSESSPNH